MTPPSGERADATPLRKALIAVGRTLATSAVWALGAVALADVWGIYPLALGSAAGRAILTAVITIGVAVIIEPEPVAPSMAAALTE